MSTPGIADYAGFLPLDYRAGVDLEPSRTTWSWRGHMVQVLRRADPDAPMRVILVHGAGGHSEALWPVASLLPGDQFDLAAVDMPLYGGTVSPDPGTVRYDGWVSLLCDFVMAEDDARPVILLGASIGGMLAYEVAARTQLPAAVVATCLLDPRSLRARAVMTRFGPFGVLGGVLATLLPAKLSRCRIPMRRVAALSKMSRNPELSRLCSRDPRGGSAPVPLGFLASFMTFRHTPPEQMSIPVTLAHPARDAWTPMEISTRWLRRTTAPTALIPLRECGHWPIEAPGLADLVLAVERTAHSITGTDRRPPRDAR